MTSIFLGKIPSTNVKPTYNYLEYKKTKIIQKYGKFFIIKQRNNDIMKERNRLKLAKIARYLYVCMCI
jgi:hypothetical protein